MGNHRPLPATQVQGSHRSIETHLGFRVNVRDADQSIGETCAKKNSNLLLNDMKVKTSYEALCDAADYGEAGHGLRSKHWRASGAAEFHHRALSEPDVSLSAHPAPGIRLLA
jgi:hypothetical protein